MIDGTAIDQVADFCFSNDILIHSNYLHLMLPFIFNVQMKNPPKTKKIKKGKLSLPQCIDLTGAKSVSRQQLQGMSKSNLEAVDRQIGKKVKATLNKHVKDAIVDVAHSEELSKLNCEHRSKAVQPVSAMIHKTKETMDKLIGTAYAICVGSWVEVLYEYAPGLCSDGGVGEVFAIRLDRAGEAWCDVSYVLDKRIEKDVHQSRITVTVMPYKDLTSTTRTKRVANATDGSVLPEGVRRHRPTETEAPIKSPLEWLRWGLTSRVHEKPGWLKDKLLSLNLLEATNEGLWKRVMSDYKCQLAGMEGMQFSMGESCKDPRETRGVQGGGGKFVSQRKESQLHVPKNIWTIPYLLHAYDVKRSSFMDKRTLDRKGVAFLTEKHRKQYNKGDCVITNRAASRRKYSDVYFFARVKALAGTIPQYKEHNENESPDVVYRQPEWRHYTTRVSYFF